MVVVLPEPLTPDDQNDERLARVISSGFATGASVFSTSAASNRFHLVRRDGLVG